MEKQEIMQMNHGEGKFSFAHNSHLIAGKLFTNKIRPMIENVINNQLLLHNTTRQSKILCIADLGCGMGPTPIEFITTIKETVHKVNSELKEGINDRQVIEEVQIYMNDLSSNDFNMLFKDMAKLQGLERDNGAPPYFVMGAPGSFYSRLFPTKTLHFIHSSTALHWLSQVPEGVKNIEGKPMNKGNIIATETSPPNVIKSYYSQFDKDFNSFLKYRSKEVVSNGSMLLFILGRESMKPCQYFLLAHLFEALASLISKGLITEEKLDSFDLPMYFPCKEEIEGIISKEGSFVIENMELKIDDIASENIKDNLAIAKTLANLVKAIFESFISKHFGDKVWNVLDNVLNQVILKHLNYNNSFHTSYYYVMTLRKKLD